MKKKTALKSSLTALEITEKLIVETEFKNPRKNMRNNGGEQLFSCAHHVSSLIYLAMCGLCPGMPRTGGIYSLKQFTSSQLDVFFFFRKSL